MAEISPVQQGGYYQYWPCYPGNIISEQIDKVYTCHIASDDSISDIIVKQIDKL